MQTIADFHQVFLARQRWKSPKTLWSLATSGYLPTILQLDRHHHPHFFQLAGYLCGLRQLHQGQEGDQVPTKAALIGKSAHGYRAIEQRYCDRVLKTELAFQPGARER